MDVITVFLERLIVILGFISLLFIPGFVITFIFFPRQADIGIVQRLAYAAVLSIGSVIALVLFMNVVLDVDTTPWNIGLGIAVFSVIMFFVWLGELWFLKSRFSKYYKSRISRNYLTLQKYHSRKSNAARDRFRQDTRTRVVYHESWPSSVNHVDHSLLLDVGEEIEILQVVENKLKITDNVIVQPPYQKTRYFELAVLEYSEKRISLVDDIEIYPVTVTLQPDRKFLGFIVRRGSIHIAERIYSKTSTAVTQWIYSRDFHLFAITHPDDTLDMMVDHILGKLDDIALSLLDGVHITSLNEQLALREAFDEVMGTVQKMGGVPEIAGPPGVLTGVVAADIPLAGDGQASAGPGKIVESPKILPSAESVPVTPSEDRGGIEARATGVSRRPVIVAGTGSGKDEQLPIILPNVEIQEIPWQPGVRPRAKAVVLPAKSPKRPDARPSTEQKEREQRKLQKEILRDLNLFAITPGSFKESGKNIENITIPKKADVDKILAELEKDEDWKDLDWLYE